MPYRIVNCRWQSGERYRMLVEASTGMPCYWPTLFASTQLRNTARSVATMEAALDAIRVLLGFVDEREIDLEERVLQGEYLRTHELDALCDQAGLSSRGDMTVSVGLRYKRLICLHPYGGETEVRAATERAVAGSSQRTSAAHDIRTDLRGSTQPMPNSRSTRRMGNGSGRKLRKQLPLR